MYTLQFHRTYALLLLIGLTSVSAHADIRSITVAAYHNNVAQLQGLAHKEDGYDKAYASTALLNSASLRQEII